jgi:hypothetical protein
MMESFNQGLLTLDRLRNGRRQVVTVQHVTVGPGGQAIVTGEVITWGVSATGRQPKMSDNPAPLGRLKNGNPRGNPANSPRCGAKTRAGSICRQPAMKNGRCRLHGGMSPGAPRGVRNGNYRHGMRTIEAAAQRRQGSAVRRNMRRLLGSLV